MRERRVLALRPYASRQARLPIAMPLAFPLRPMRNALTPLAGELTVVRPATASDVDLLVEWHADPAVAAFWDDRTFTREEMLARLARFDVDAYLIEAAGKPVGYLQAWFDDEAANCGIDMFLIPSARGRGLGPDSARAGSISSARGRADASHRRPLCLERACYPRVEESGLPPGRGARARRRALGRLVADDTRTGLARPRSAGLLTPQPGAF